MRAQAGGARSSAAGLRTGEISVLIPTFNSKETLEEGLRCLFESEGGRGLDVVVIDNGSADGTAEWVRERFPKARLIRNEVNEGFAKAVNRGWRETDRPYVCFLNDDARATGEDLSRMAEFLEGHPEAGIVGPQLVYEDGRLQNSIDNIPSLTDQFVNKSVLRRLFPRRYPGKRARIEGPVEAESVIGASLMARRELLEKTQGLDERYFVFLEETDLCLQARRLGFRVMLLPQVRVVHLQGATSGRRAPHRARVEYLRSMIRFFRKNRPGVAWLYELALPGKTFVELAGAGLATVLTLGLARGVRRRAGMHAWVFAWLALFRPSGFGLKDVR